MNYNNYLNYISSETLMGPSCARILEELLKKQPLQLNKGNVVLDLGCGKGLTSLIIAKETGASVVANDLWISEEDNRKRFDEWGVGERITPARRDANDLAFESAQFDALFSVDAYHYFATEQGFFEDKILPFLKNGAVVLIGVPGIKKEYTGRAEELLPEWLGDEAYMFKSTSEWREIIGKHDRIERVETWEMECFETAWTEWFATGNRYAVGDKAYYETLIKPYTCFVGICIKLK